eukprot:scaffold62173_cov54-Prasinocladus_malaysianus.AAC.1
MCDRWHYYVSPHKYHWIKYRLRNVWTAGPTGSSSPVTTSRAYLPSPSAWAFVQHVPTETPEVQSNILPVDSPDEDQAAPPPNAEHTLVMEGRMSLDSQQRSSSTTPAKRQCWREKGVLHR